MRGWRRTAAWAGAGAVLIASAACAPKVASTGQSLADPAAALDTALAQLKKDNYAGIQNNSITVSSATECFYSKASKDAKGISDQAVCGPIRRLGRSDSQVWDRYRLTFGTDKDGNAVAKVGPHTAQGVAVDTSLLVSPAGDKPAAATDLPAPQAPQTSITDRAVAVAAAAAPSGLAFTPPAHPVTVITPAATITVTGTAQPRTVPDALVAGQNDPAGKAAYYLPASGQKLYAYQLQLSAPPDSGRPVATGGSSQPQHPATTLKISADGKKLPIVDQTGAGTAAASTLTIPCALSGSACKPHSTKIIVLMTVPSSGPVALAAASAGSDQVVDLGTGAVTSSDSTVEYGRNQLTVKIGKRLQTGPYQVKLQQPVTAPTAGPKPKHQTSPKPTNPPKPKIITAEARWSMRVDQASLAGYDPGLGWAPKGKAWLIISTSNYRRTDAGATFTDHRAASLSVTAGGTSYPVKSPTDAELAAHPSSDVAWAFVIPADVTSVTLGLRPTGTAAAGGVTSDFSSDQVATLPIDLPH